MFFWLINPRVVRLCPYHLKAGHVILAVVRKAGKKNRVKKKLYFASSWRQMLHEILIFRQSKPTNSCPNRLQWIFDFYFEFLVRRLWSDILANLMNKHNFECVQIVKQAEIRVRREIRCSYLYSNNHSSMQLWMIWRDIY